MDLAQIESRQRGALVRSDAEHSTTTGPQFNSIYKDVNVSGSSSLNTGPVFQTVHKTVQQSSLTQEQQCHQALKTSLYEQRKNRNPLRAEGTCNWVLENPRFKEWRQGKNNALLWISADPGCGKSVLSRSLVDKDLKDGQTTICYFFFKDNEEQDNVAAALCALLHQLFAQQPNLIHHAIPAWLMNGDKLCREIPELWRILGQAVADAAATPVICVLDALDECKGDDRADLITQLCSLQQTRTNRAPQTCKVLATSRPYDDVRRWFGPTIKQWPQIHLRGEDESHQVQKEINLVISGRVEELANEFALSEARRTNLRNQLLNMQHRTYLWLHLAIEELRRTFFNSLFPDDVDIHSLPSSVEEAYERILREIKPEQRSNARRVLCIIVGARRPLDIHEMALALGAARSYEQSRRFMPTVNVEQLEKRICDWCGLFIYIQDSQLFLIHQTAREFLTAQHSNIQPQPGTWRSSLSQIEVDREMAIICITYLHNAHNQEQKQEALNTDQLTSIIHNTFHDYCATFWVSHSENEMIWNDEKLLEHALALYDADTSLFRSWFPGLWNWIVLKNHNQQAIAFTGHTGVFKELYMRKKFDLETQDGEGMTTLARAACIGSESLTKWLLENGADPNGLGAAFGSALYIAVELRHKNIVRILLENGANPDSSGAVYGNALCLAVRENDTEMVRMLLEKGANPNAYSKTNRSALDAAAGRSNKELTQILLESGANADSLGGVQILYSAIRDKDTELVRLLLKQGADPNSDIQYENSVLYAAVARSNKEIVQILLENGANPDSLGADYGNALCLAVRRNDTEMVRLLLEKGANPNAYIQDEGSVLYAAAKWSKWKIAQILLENGAKVNDTEANNGNALYTAVTRGDISATNLLLAIGANPKIPSGPHGNAFCTAVATGQTKILQALFQVADTLNISIDDLEGPLLLAIRIDSKEMLRVLLDGLAAIGGKRGLFQTAINEAVRQRRPNMMQVLNECYDGENGQEHKLGVEIMIAALKGDEEKMHLLLDRSPYANVPERDFKTAIYLALEYGNWSTAQKLLKMVTGVNSEGSKSETVLQTEAKDMDDKVWQILLDEVYAVPTKDQCDTALEAAASQGLEKLVKLLYYWSFPAGTDRFRIRSKLAVLHESGDIERALFKATRDHQGPLPSFGLPDFHHLSYSPGGYVRYRSVSQKGGLKTSYIDMLPTTPP